MKGRNLLLSAGFAAALALPLTASATNGYFSHGYGTANKALAGAGVAMPQDALAAATNPAGITRLGHRADLGLALFSPQREYTVAGNPSGFPGTFPLMPGTYDSDSNYFLIPNFGYNRPLDDKSAFGIAIYGNGGMNTDWPNVTNFGGTRPPGTYYDGPAGVDDAHGDRIEVVSRARPKLDLIGVALGRPPQERRLDVLLDQQFGEGHTIRLLTMEGRHQPLEIRPSPAERWRPELPQRS